MGRRAASLLSEAERRLVVSPDRRQGAPVAIGGQLMDGRESVRGSTSQTDRRTDENEAELAEMGASLLFSGALCKRAALHHCLTWRLLVSQVAADRCTGSRLVIGLCLGRTLRPGRRLGSARIGRLARTELVKLGPDASKVVLSAQVSEQPKQSRCGNSDF